MWVVYASAAHRFEPRNLAFADGLDGWLLGGSFTEHARDSHWRDYSCTAEHGIAVLSSAVPQPDGYRRRGGQSGIAATICSPVSGSVRTRTPRAW